MPEVSLCIIKLKYLMYLQYKQDYLLGCCHFHYDTFIEGVYKYLEAKYLFY